MVAIHKDPRHIPADPLLVLALENAKQMQEREYQNDLRLMNRYAPEIRRAFPGYDFETRIAGQIHQRVNLNVRGRKEKLRYMDPEDLRIAQNDFRLNRDHTINVMKGCANLSEQGEALVQSGFASFGATIEEGLYFSTHQRMQRFIELTKQEYAQLTARPDPSVPVNRLAREVLLDIFDKLSIYNRMAVKAYDYIGDLTQAWQCARGVNIDTIDPMPDDLAAKRLINASGKEPKDFTEADYDKIEDFTTNILNDLFKQFDDGLPPNTTVILSWFIGEALEVIRKERGESRAVKFRDDAFKEVGVPTSFANDVETDEVVTSASMVVRGYDTGVAGFVGRTPANENLQFNVDMLQDPSVRRRVCEMLKDVFEKTRYNDAGIDLYSLTEAAEYFRQKYHIREKGDRTPD